MLASVSSGASLGYSVASSPEVTKILVDYGGDSIRIVLPSSIAQTWAEGNQVTIEGFPAPDFQILIEKDFRCLHNPEREDPDAYPNPIDAVARPADD